ncbi:MAG TPA: 30S ribosomal protein S6 [Chthoniobacteraceae bacterium]|nr:30S ribosomal protein S6 [Chthoniobacteraceae bacterium]
MKKRYEALLVLNIKGSEESAKEVIERIEGEFKKEGARVEQVQKMDRRQFSYAAGPLDSGYFVNFVFQAEPEAMEKLRAHFKLDEEIYRQHFQKVPPKKERPVRTPRAPKAAA